MIWRKWGVLLCLYFLAFPVSAADGDLFQVRVNRLQGILDFAYSYCGGPYESVALQKVLESAGHRSGEPLEAMVRFCGVNIHRGPAHLPDRPQVYSAGGTSLWDRLTKASVTSAGMDELADFIADELTAEEQRAVLGGMREMEPLYRRLVEEPYGARAAATGQALSDYLRMHDVESMMHRVAHLYSTPWPEDMPLWIGLSPIPAGEASFSATVKGNVVRSFLPADYDQLDIYAGVMAHEFAHVLFSTMSMDSVRRLQGAFLDAPSPARRYAETWMNEALATAAGNAWLYRELNGEPQDGEWYSDPVVDAYAKAIAPAAHAALDAGVQMDEALVARFVEAFDRAFPDALNDPAVILPHAVLVVDAGDDVGAMDSLGAIYRNRVEVRALHVEPFDSATYVPGDWWPTVIRVELADSPGSGFDWKRRVLQDGGLEFSAKIAGVQAFDPALEDLIARIGAADW